MQTSAMVFGSEARSATLTLSAVKTPRASWRGKALWRSNTCGPTLTACGAVSAVPLSVCVWGGGGGGGNFLILLCIDWSINCEFRKWSCFCQKHSEFTRSHRPRVELELKKSRELELKKSRERCFTALELHPLSPQSVTYSG